MVALARRTAAHTAAAFPVTYEQGLPPLPPRGSIGPVAQRWAWFRVAVLLSCRRWPRATCELLAGCGIDRDSSEGRIALRNLSHLVRDGFLCRGEEGYRATDRGQRVIDDLDLLGDVYESAEVG
jgi:hypothetical protein